MPSLGVNIDHVATIRQVRGGIEPDPVYAAFLCQTAGADSIVVHLREDRRHIKDRDVFILKDTVKIKLNLEMSVAEDIVGVACKVKPDQATLVPEKRQEVTTEGGLDAASNIKKISRVISRLEKAGTSVSLFIDPEKKQILASKKTGARIIELHTGRFADAKTASQRRLRLQELEAAVHFAKEKNLTVNAGHGLNYFNARQVAVIKGIEELNIGYSIVCRACLVGMVEAVRQMKALIG